MRRGHQEGEAKPGTPHKGHKRLGRTEHRAEQMRLREPILKNSDSEDETKNHSPGEMKAHTIWSHDVYRMFPGLKDRL